MKYILYINTSLIIAGVFVFAFASPVEAISVLEPRGQEDAQEIEGEDGPEKYLATEIKGMVEEEFGDGHPMVAIARCESSFRQFDNDGDVLRNPESDAIGIFQILEGLHEEPADKLGFDIFTAEGNIGYARKLYDSFGLAPWSPSSLCWDDGSINTTNPSGVDLQQQAESTRVPVKVRSDGELEPLFENADDEASKQEMTEPAENQLITKKLVSGVTDPQVRDLQRLLNDIGYRLSSSGPGSPGKETDFFGAKTRAAVQKFQCENDIVCSGGRYSTGYGLVDQKTRQALNQAAAERERGIYRIGDVQVRTDNNPDVAREKDNQEDNDTQNEMSEATGKEFLRQELEKAQKLVSNLAAQINNQ